MGLTVLDAGVIVGFLDRGDAHHHAARAALREAYDQRHQLVLPASALAEVLVGPSRAGEKAIAMARRLIDRVPIEVAALDADVALAAAALRARHKALKLPDALVIATAAGLDADKLITTDRGWPTRSKLQLRATIVEL